MSDVGAEVVACPRCGREQAHTVFSSLNLDVIEAQRAAIAEGSFERRACEGCGEPFRPEHRLLVTWPGAGALFVLFPVGERRKFAAIEPVVEAELSRELSAAPPIAARAFRGLAPRLLFGQHALTEAVRVLDAGLDPALLECAKLYAVRHNLPALMPLGLVELCFERVAPGGELEAGIHSFDTGARLGDFTLPPGALAEAQKAEPALRAAYPALFTRPYVSACRILYGAA